MKPNKPELSAKWWSAVCPDGVDGKKVLEKALAKAEKALADQAKKSDDQRAVESAISTVKSLPAAVAKAMKECDKKKDKDVLVGLKQLQKDAEAEVARLTDVKKNLASGGDGDDEEDEGKLFDKDYLHKLIKLIKSGGKELNFAFGMDPNSPEACDFLLHRKKSSEMLFKIIKKTKKFPNRLLTYGTAKMDATDKQTLVFFLAPSANVPPKKIVRTGRKLFQMDKKLRFKKLKIVAANGETFEDSEPEEAAAAGAAAGAGAGAQAQVSPEQRQEARDGIQRIEEELRRMAAELNINV